jgi:hypothetical protein
MYQRFEFLNRCSAPFHKISIVHTNLSWSTPSHYILSGFRSLRILIPLITIIELRIQPRVTIAIDTINGSASKMVLQKVFVVVVVWYMPPLRKKKPW